MSRRDLECFASMDWGYNAPGCVLWWLVLPENGYHIIHEFKFQQMSSEEVAQRVLKISDEIGAVPQYVTADPAMWAKTGANAKGESIAETLMRFGLRMRRSDNDRFNGWQRVHALLRDMNADRPWLTVEPTCRYLIRSMQNAISDKKDPDDVDTTTDDHALDALRYGAMSRPPVWTERDRREKAPLPPNSWGWWRRYHARQDQRRSAIA